jgi:erythromycin esterase
MTAYYLDASALTKRYVQETGTNPGPARFIPTHSGRGLPSVEIAALPVRSGSVKNPTYFPLTPQSSDDLDWLVVLDSTT